MFVGLVALVCAVAVLVFLVAYLSHKKSASVEFNLVGSVGTVEAELNPTGAVLAGGEVWRARTAHNGRIERGTPVRVLGAEGHLLTVEEVENTSMGRLSAR